MSKLYFRYGAMGSSKTTNALMVWYNYRERGQTALLVKPKLDNRDGDRIVASRAGLSEPCVFMEELPDYFSSSYKPGSVDCIIVDEAQFLSFYQTTRRFYPCPPHNMPIKRMFTYH